MQKPAMPRKPNPELLDTDTPEATEEWFAKARPASELLPGLFGQSAAQEMLNWRGWQIRLNNALRDRLKTHPKVNGV